jgi:hypothetical protein
MLIYFGFRGLWFDEGLGLGLVEWGVSGKGTKKGFEVADKLIAVSAPCRFPKWKKLMFGLRGIAYFHSRRNVGWR